MMKENNMQIFRHLTANDIKLEPFPFKRELSMEAYIVENERVLSLDSNIFSNVEIIDVELTLKQGRKRIETDGRIDILATYSQEYIAIVELKLGKLENIHLTQLEDYLDEKEQIRCKYPDIFDEESIVPKWIGVLVGDSIEPNLAALLANGYVKNGIQIAALTIQRYRGKDGQIYVTTDTYFKLNKMANDSTQYDFEGSVYGKGKLVLAVVKHYVESHPNISYAELEKIFPKSCQGSYGVFTTIEKAAEIAQKRKRHFLNPDEIIVLSDSTIAVCSQWGSNGLKSKGNIEIFIAEATKLGFIIRTLNS